MEGIPALFRNSQNYGCISKPFVLFVLCAIREFLRIFIFFLHSRASNKRLERITKGHRLWHIVDKQDNDGESWDEDWAAGEDKGAHHETKETHQAPSGGLKDLGVDLDVSLFTARLVPVSGRIYKNIYNYRRPPPGCIMVW